MNTPVNVTITESWNKKEGTKSICFGLDVFKAGDFIVITYDGNGRIEAPGFKEAGLKGGLIITSDQKWSVWSDKDLERVGLRRIPQLIQDDFGPDASKGEKLFED